MRLGKGMALAATLALTCAATAARAEPPLTEGPCSLLVEIDGKTQTVGPIPDLHVLHGSEKLSVSTPPGAKLRAVICERSSMVPDSGDYRVLMLGVPFMVRVPEPGPTIAMRSVNGAMRIVPIDTPKR
jgi:hypothetical protein